MEELNKNNSKNEDPFEEAERNFSFKLQSSLKKILLANGFDNSYVISKINESDISSTEDFARNTLPDLISESEYKEYYGIFKKNISKFKFLDGHKKQLTMVVEYYKNLYSNKFEINKTPESNQKVNKNKPSQKINISKEHKVKNKLDDKQVLNINLPEEKKIIEQNISEWINRKYNVKHNENDTDSVMYNKQDLIKNILDNQTVSVKLCSQTFNEEDPDNIEFNNVIGDITCFCGIHTKVFKRTLTGRTHMTWVLSNYYRHIINHVENQGKKKIFKGSVQQTNTVKNYFTLANKGNVELTATHESTQKSTTLEVIPCTSTKQIQDSSKWSDIKYSRSERAKRAREQNLINCGEKQLLITNYFEIVDKITNYVNEHNIFIESLEDLQKSMPPWKETPAELMLKKTDTSTLLKSLCNAALDNSKSASKNANRYNESLKKFCVFLYFVGGRLLYETLQSNLVNSLPSISSLNRFISLKKDIVVEGEYRFKQLKTFLTERDLPLCIWVSEDATRLTSKIEYDSISNKIVGFVLPFSNGEANVNAYLATSATTIADFFQKNDKANYAYVIMAKPLQDTSSTFCLSIFGTNNKFTSEDVINRWNVMQKLASEVGIKILGFSSDGDTRLLKAMQTSAYSQQSSQYYIQDTVHIGTKLRTRFLKPNVTLPIGNFLISASHLQELIETYSKDKHFLTRSDLIPEDKMNFRSAEKMCAPTVLELLKHIPESQGTIAFLKSMNYVLTSFLNKSLTVEDRIYRIWYGVYFFRMWRYSILKNTDYTLKNNFITSNAYACIELNARSLILLVKQFRDSSYSLRPYMFVPWHFSSQACEELFRTTRSMTSTYSTVVNFSMNDILKRLTRIELLNSVQNDLYENEVGVQNENPSDQDSSSNHQNNFNFPRFNKHSRHFINASKFNSTVTETATYETMSDPVIDNICTSSLSDVKEMANILGIPLFTESFEEPQFLSRHKDANIDNYQSSIQGNEYDNEYDNEYNNEYQDDYHNVTPTTDINLNDSSTVDVISEDTCKDLCEISKFGNFGDFLNLKDYSDCEQFLNAITVTQTDEQNSDTEFTRITLNNKKQMIIKKSSFCWLLDNKIHRVSNDRLRRFMNVTDQNPQAKLKRSIRSKQQSHSKQKRIKKQKKQDLNIHKSPSKLPNFLLSSNENSSENSDLGSDIENDLANVKRGKKIPIEKNKSKYVEPIDDESDDSSLFKEENKIPAKKIKFKNGEYISSSGSELEIESDDKSIDEKNLKIDIKLESYYAIYYEDTWYLGRVIDFWDENKTKIKFMKKDLDNYIWPRKEDIYTVENRFIFYGPIDLVGNYPFKIKRSDGLRIIKEYKNLKKKT